MASRMSSKPWLVPFLQGPPPPTLSACSSTLGLCTCVLSCLSHVQLFVSPWTVARQTSLSMGFFRQECWRGYWPPWVMWLSLPMEAPEEELMVRFLYSSSLHVLCSFLFLPVLPPPPVSPPASLLSAPSSPFTLCLLLMDIQSFLQPSFILLFLNFIYFGCALQRMGLVASRQVGSLTGDQTHVPCIGRWIS